METNQNESKSEMRRKSLSMFSKKHSNDFHAIYSKPSGSYQQTETIKSKAIESRIADCEKLVQRLSVITSDPTVKYSKETATNSNDLMSRKILNEITVTDSKFQTNRDTPKAIMDFNAIEKRQEFQSRTMQITNEQQLKCRNLIDDCFHLLNDKPTWLEKEIFRKRMLETSSNQYHFLPHVVTPRDITSMRLTPLSIAYPFSSIDKKDKFISWADQAPHVSIGLRGRWNIVTYNDSRGGAKYRYFVDSKSNIVQIGEPFHFRIRRVAGTLVEKPWIPYDKNFRASELSILKEKGCKLLADEYSGLVIYCPDVDIFLSSSVDLSALRSQMIITQHNTVKSDNSGPPLKSRKEIIWKSLLTSRIRDNIKTEITLSSNQAIQPATELISVEPNKVKQYSSQRPKSASSLERRRRETRDLKVTDDSQVILETHLNGTLQGVTAISNPPSPGKIKHYRSGYTSASLRATSQNDDTEAKRLLRGKLQNLSSENQIQELTDLFESPSVVDSLEFQKLTEVLNDFRKSISSNEHKLLLPGNQGLVKTRTETQSKGKKKKRHHSKKKDLNGLDSTLRRLSMSKVESAVATMSRRQSFIEEETHNRLKDIDMTTLEFERKLSSSSKTEFFELLKAISSNPIDMASILKLVLFLLSNGLGTEALAVYQFALKLPRKSSIDKLNAVDLSGVVWPSTQLNNMTSNIFHLFLLQTYRQQDILDLSCLKQMIQYAGRLSTSSSKSVNENASMSSTILDLLARFVKVLKHDDLSEMLFIGALLMCPLSDTALFGYANLMVEKGNFSAAIKYFNRIDEKSHLYGRAKVHIAYIYELVSNQDEMIHHSVKAALRGSNVNGLSSTKIDIVNRATTMANEGLGFQSYLSREWNKSKEFYKTAMFTSPFQFSSYLLCACLPIVLKNHSDTSKYDGYLGIDEADACYRRGLLSQPTDFESKYLTYFAYGNFLLHTKQDFQLAERYLEISAKLSSTICIWPTIATAHYHQYIKQNLSRAKHLLLTSLEQRYSMISQHTGKKYSNNYIAGFETFEFAQRDINDDDNSILNDGKFDANTLERNQFDAVDVTRSENLLSELYLDCCILHVALGYVFYDEGDDINAVKQANASFAISQQIQRLLSSATEDLSPISSAYRLLAIVAWKQPTQRKDALKFYERAFNADSIPSSDNNRLSKSFKESSQKKDSKPALFSNPYTLRQCSLAFASEGKFKDAYESIEEAAVANQIASQHPLIWKTLGIMSYLYRSSPENAAVFLTKAWETSQCLDVEATLLLGQILLELERFAEARNAFQQGLKVTPTNPVLWAHLAIAVRQLHTETRQTDQNKHDPEPIYTAFPLSYDDKCESLSSLRQLIDSVDSDEIMFIATKLLQFELSNQPLTDDVTSIWSPSHYYFHVKTEGNSSTSITPELADVIYLCAMYFYDQDSMRFKEYDNSYSTRKQSTGFKSQAKTLLTQLMEDKSVTRPYPLAAFILGWITENETFSSLILSHHETPDYKDNDNSDHNNATEISGENVECYDEARRCFDYCIRCCHDTTQVDLYSFLRLYQAFEESYKYVTNQLQSIETAMSQYHSKSFDRSAIRLTRKSSTTSRLKQRQREYDDTEHYLDQSGMKETMLLSMRNMKPEQLTSNTLWSGEDYENELKEIDKILQRQSIVKEYQHQLSILRQRKDMHQQYLQSMLKLKQSGRYGEARIINQISPPRKFFNVSNDWIDRLMASFSVCDDWTYLRAIVRKLGYQQ